MDENDPAGFVQFYEKVQSGRIYRLTCSVSNFEIGVILSHAAGSVDVWIDVEEKNRQRPLKFGAGFDNLLDRCFAQGFWIFSVDSRWSSASTSPRAHSLRKNNTIP